MEKDRLHLDTDCKGICKAEERGCEKCPDRMLYTEQDRRKRSPTAVVAHIAGEKLQMAYGKKMPRPIAASIPDSIKAMI